MTTKTCGENRSHHPTQIIPLEQTIREKAVDTGLERIGKEIDQLLERRASQEFDCIPRQG
jgi:hypothetical protein